MSSTQFMQRFLAYVVLAVGLALTIGCQTDLDLESKTWACQTDSDCRGGQVCVGATANEKGICEPMTGDASMDAEDDAADTADTDNVSDTADSTDGDAADTDDTVDTDTGDTEDTTADGDADQSDSDGDGISNANDNCPDTANPAQNDDDGDGVGDACDLVRSLADAATKLSGDAGARLGASLDGNFSVNLLESSNGREFIVGAPGIDTTYIIEGSNSRNPALPSLQTLIMVGDSSGDEFGTDVEFIGDFLTESQDRVPDFLVRANAANGNDPYVQAFHIDRNNNEPAEKARLVKAGSQIGAGMTSIVEFDDQPGPDLLIGDPSSQSGEGSLYVFGGSPAQQSNFNGDINSWSAQPQVGVSGSSGFGSSLANLGGISGANNEYVAVGSPGDNIVYVIQGPQSLDYGDQEPPANATVATIDGPTTADSFGVTVARVPDVNGDGEPELAVGAIGGVWVFDGANIASSTTISHTDALVHVTASGAIGARLGNSLAGLDDMEGDQGGEVLIGFDNAEVDGQRTGAAYLLPSSAYDATTETVDVSDLVAFVGEGAGAETGASVTDIGDYDGDNIPDLAIGAPGTGSNAGAVYVYFGPFFYGPQD